ncbi:MAG: T9SS type A sorting domain-containing protein [Saprospiraceae bacterium]
MSKFIPTSIICLFLFVFGKPVAAQDYMVEATYLGSKTKAELFAIFFQPVEFDVDLYKITYKTVDVNLQPDTASGLLVLPQVADTTRLPILVYNHGTTAGPDDVPSRLEGGYEVAMAFAAFGFATVAPDYIGLGDSEGFHPYLHAASEASASLDMLFAGYEYLEFNDPDLDPNYLFLTGYSQGGHASMALHKEIEDFWSIIIPVTAATHISGPYSLSGVMRDRVLSDLPYGYPSYIAYIFLGFNEAYHLYDSIGDVFKEPYAQSIDSFYNEEIDLTVLNNRLLAYLTAAGNTSPKTMLQDSIVDALANDLNHPINEALANNDTYNFAPTAPTRLYYCGGDTQVPPLNSVIADSVMNELGANDVQAINLNANFDHGTCLLTAVPNTIEFFKSFLLASSIDDLGLDAAELKVFPNPVLDFVIIDWDAARSGCAYEIYNSSGEIMLKGISASNKIDMKGLVPGMYMIICTTADETRLARLIKQ